MAREGSAPHLIRKECSKDSVKTFLVLELKPKRLGGWVLFSLFLVYVSTHSFVVVAVVLNELILKMESL